MSNPACAGLIHIYNYCTEILAVLNTLYNKLPDVHLKRAKTSANCSQDLSKYSSFMRALVSFNRIHHYRITTSLQNTLLTRWIHSSQ